mmetsp:Transcript_45410/g.50551  ORF Transcript_45410/g.50551 Transcript_45410/m.50551 type:complete len:100 (+) Transcript_45410:220-519(+)
MIGGESILLVVVYFVVIRFVVFVPAAAVSAIPFIQLYKFLQCITCLTTAVIVNTKLHWIISNINHTYIPISHLLTHLLLFILFLSIPQAKKNSLHMSVC